MSNEVNPVVRFNNVRLAFAHLYEMHAPPNSPGAKPAYSADFIVDPVANRDEWKSLEATIQGMAAAKWPEISAQVLEVINSDRKLRCYGKGDEKKEKKTMMTMGGFEGMLYIGGRSTDVPPDMYNQRGERIDPDNAIADNPTLYAGCYVNMAVKLWLQDNTHGRAVRGELVALQFVKDGEPFASHKVDTSSMFAPVAGAPEPTAGGFAPEASDGSSVSFL